MSIINKTVKGAGYIGVYIATFFQCYVLSAIVTGSLLSFTGVIMSIVSDIPEVVIKKFHIFFLLASFPIAFIFFFSVIAKTLNKKHR